MQEFKKNGFLLYYRKINEKFNYMCFLTNKNEIMFLLINTKDWPQNIKIGERWKMTIVDSRQQFLKWVWGEKQEKSPFPNDEWVINVNYWIRQIISTKQDNVNFFDFYKNLKWINSDMLFLKIAMFFLKILGQNLTFNFCIICKKDKIWGINFDVGGSLCGFCAKEEKIWTLKSDLLETLKKIGENKFFQGDSNFAISSKKINFCSWLIAEFIDERCGFYSKIQWIKPKVHRYFTNLFQ